MFRPLPAALALALLPLAAPAEGLWTDDFEAAKAAAEKDGKDLLIDFTGSDWCGWCIRLKKEVFDRAEFKTGAVKHFVLVELDFPQEKELPEKTREQNKRLAAAFGVEGYPTIYLADARGRTYGKTGYQEGGPVKYLEHLAELRRNKAARDELLAKADQAQGVEKAKLLDQAIAAAGENPAGYGDLEKQIIALDAANEAGLRDRYRLRALTADVQALQREEKFEAAAAKVDAFIAEAAPKGALRREAFMMKANVLFNREDLPGTVAALEAARDAEPGTPEAEKIGTLIERVKAMNR